MERAWLTETQGAAFFLPQRWLVVTTTTSARQFRQVDGIERQHARAAFVYEIKRSGSGYRQLVEEYVPLLARAFPPVQFVPIEINADDPYHGGPPPGPIRRLGTLAERRLDTGYQLLVRPRPALRPARAALAPPAVEAPRRTTVSAGG